MTDQQGWEFFYRDASGKKSDRDMHARILGAAALAILARPCG